MRAARSHHAHRNGLNPNTNTRKRVTDVMHTFHLEAAVVDDFLHPLRRRRVDGRNEFVHHLVVVYRAASIYLKI